MRLNLGDKDDPENWRAGMNPVTSTPKFIHSESKASGTVYWRKVGDLTKFV